MKAGASISSHHHHGCWHIRFINPPKKRLKCHQSGGAACYTRRSAPHVVRLIHHELLKQTNTRQRVKLWFDVLSHLIRPLEIILIYLQWFKNYWRFCCFKQQKCLVKICNSGFEWEECLLWCSILWLLRLWTFKPLDLEAGQHLHLSRDHQNKFSTDAHRLISSERLVRGCGSCSCRQILFGSEQTPDRLIMWAQKDPVKHSQFWWFLDQNQSQKPSDVRNEHQLL